MWNLRQRVVTAAFALVAGSALAQVQVQDAWIRATVPGLMATGMFAKITSATDAKLISASSPVAAVVEVHEMKLEQGIMKMRAVTALDLPAGRSVELKPGGYHVMLMDLRQTMKAGEVVPVTLVVQGADGRKESIEVRATVRGMQAGKHSGH